MTRTSEGLAAFVVDQLEELYRRMWVLRLLDMALEQLRIEGLINGPLQGGFGQEAVSVGAAAALGEGDVIITTHRPHAQHVGTDAPLGPVIADMLGATAGDLEGADEDAHIADPRAGLPAAIRVVKQSPLLAIGHAYALWLRDTGRVTLCVTQDCDVDADAFNEAADLAAVWQLPVVILVENIRGALSVHLDRYTHEPRVYRRAVAYGMPGVSVDGNDVEAVRDCVANAVVRARAGGGPTLVQAITYRTTDFSGSDRGGYRDLAGSEQFLDPLIFARRRLIAAGTTRARPTAHSRPRYPHSPRPRAATRTNPSASQRQPPPACLRRSATNPGIDHRGNTPTPHGARIHRQPRRPPAPEPRHPGASPTVRPAPTLR